MGTSTRQERFKVVIAGGGVAAVEAALALRELAGERVSMTMVAPGDFVYRPLAVLEPFSSGGARRYSLVRMGDDIGFDLVTEKLAWVDPPARTAHTASGAGLAYDALIIALGARAHPRFHHAITVDDRRLDELVHGLVQDVEGGYVRTVAFVVPGRMAWPLPIYELALMTAARAREMNVELAVTVVTPEDGPLAIFGEQASRACALLLQDAGISTITSAYAEIPETGHVAIHPEDRHLRVDRIVALPELFGPEVGGLRLTENGFIPVDVYCQVRGADRVYAAGDATDFAVKHGGVAAQQAVVAARAVAALAGAPVEPRPFDPEIHGILLTGGAPKYLSAHIRGGHGFSSELADEPGWQPPGKIVAEYLGPYLAKLEAIGMECPEKRGDGEGGDGGECHHGT